MRTILAFLFGSVAFCSTALADLDKYQKEGLSQTKSFLKNPSERQKAVDADPHAKDIDEKAGALAGTPENKEQMYDVASQLIEKIAAEANGDPAKMQEMMAEAQKNPEAFYNKYFDDAQKAKVRDIAKKSESSKPGLNRK